MIGVRYAKVIGWRRFAAIGVMEGRGMSAGASRYKVDPAPVFLFAYISGSLACSAFVVVLALFDPAFQHAKLPAVLETIGYVLVFFGPPYAALCALVLTYYFRYDVTADGVRGQNAFGRTLFVQWSEVTSMKPIRIANLEFVRVSGRDNTSTIWLPMFVRSASSAEPSLAIWGVTPPATAIMQPRAAAKSGM